MPLPFSLQSLSSQLNTPIFTSPLQFNNHRDTTVVFKTKNQLPTCNHHGLLLSSSPDSNQCHSRLLRRDGRAIPKLSWGQGLAATHAANLVPPCLVTARENKIEPKTPYKTNKRLRNSSPGPSNGKINVLSPQQDQVRRIFARFIWRGKFNEMKTASEEEHDHALLERNSLNRINKEISKLKDHADQLKSELDKLLSNSNPANRTAHQSHEVNRDQNKRKANEEAENSWPGVTPTGEDDTRSAKKTRHD